MRNSRTHERAKPTADALAVDQQRDARDGIDREPEPSQRMRMPHERDESAASSAGSGSTTPSQAGVMEQAHKDVERGLQDTDCRGTPDLSESACPPRPRAARPPARGRAAETPARTGRGAARRRSPR